MAGRKYGSKASMVHSPVRTEFSPGKTVERVSKGLPFGELEALRGEIDEPLESLARYLSISRSTLQRRRAERRLSAQESDRVMRFWRLLQHAKRVFGNVDRARQWLKFPQRGLNQAVPLDYASTEVGAREVENLLGRIDYEAGLLPGGSGTLEEPPSEQLRRLHVDSVCAWPPALRLALEVFGPQQVLFGSDEPYWRIADGVSTVDAATLDPAAVAAVWYENAERIFRLGEP